MSGAKWEAQKDMVPYSPKVVLIAKTYPLKHSVGTKFRGKPQAFLATSRIGRGLVLIETGRIKSHGNTLLSTALASDL